MAAFNKYQQFVEDLAKKVHNLDSDVLKVALSNSPPNAATHKLLADITEISAGNGYAAGGNTAAFVSGVQAAGTYKLVLSNVTFTAAAGSIATFQYAVLYNSTSSSPLKPLIGWYDYGTSLIVTSGNSFTVQFDATNGVLTLA